VHDILQAIRTAHGRDLTTAEDADRGRVAEALGWVRLAEKSKALSITLEDLVASEASRAPERLSG